MLLSPDVVDCFSPLPSEPLASASLLLWFLVLVVVVAAAAAAAVAALFAHLPSWQLSYEPLHLSLPFVLVLVVVPRAPPLDLPETRNPNPRLD